MEEPAIFRPIVDLAGNRRIRKAITNLSFSIQRYHYFGVSRRYLRSAKEHLDIIAAFLQRDPAAAGGAMARELDRPTEDRRRLLIPGPGGDFTTRGGRMP